MIAYICIKNTYDRLYKNELTKEEKTMKHKNSIIWRGEEKNKQINKGELLRK